MKPILYIVFALTFFACNDKKEDQNKKPFSQCKCGKPEPIFKDGSSDVIVNRNFTMTQESALENVSFKDGTELQIVQSGCNEIIQEFSFFYQKDESKGSPEFWKNKAIAEFEKIGTLNTRYQPFTSWANAIKLAAPNMKLGEATELEKDFFITIDKVNNGKDIQLLVKVHAKSC